MKMKKNERKSQGRGSGGCVQRTEVIVKRKKSHGGGGVTVYVNGEVRLLCNLKKNLGGQVGGGGRRVLGQGGCDRRSEVFEKIQKKNFFWGGRVGPGGPIRGWGGGGGSKVWGRWVMWGMGDVNKG